MSATSGGTGLNLRKWGVLLSTSTCILCLISSVQGVAEPLALNQRTGASFLGSKSSAFAAPLFASGFGLRRATNLRSSRLSTCQQSGIISTTSLFGRTSQSQGPGFPSPSDTFEPILMHKRHGLGLSQTLPSSSRPQTQLRVLADICEEERDYREADIRGTRLFVTGLPSSVDDIRLYLAFEEYGRVLEAQVAKPGLGFVVFEDMETADEALAGMEGEAISGKEIRVKRARSFYIRKEEEARLKLAQAAREREMRTAALAEEHSRRVRILEEAAYARVENQGLASHVRHFDVRGQRRAVLEEMRAEGLLDLSTPLPYQQTPHQLDSKPVRPSEERSMMDEEQHPSDGYGRYNGRSPSPQRRMPQYIDAENGHKQLRQQMEDGLRGEEEEEEEGMGLGGGEAAAWSLTEEERIKKQAMIEIMKEGDKLSKSGLKGVEVNINIAQLIRERVEQIKRYEMLRDNRELLCNITFTSFPTQNVRTTGIPGYTMTPGSLDEDEESDDDGVSVTPEEEALVKMIADDRLNGHSKLQPDDAKPAAAVKRKRGRPRKTAAAKKKAAYVPTGRPRGRPRKTPKPE